MFTSSNIRKILVLPHSFLLSALFAFMLFLAPSESIAQFPSNPTPGYIYTYAGTSPGGYEGDGGPAYDAQMNGPRALAFDTQGDLYISDFDNGLIRKVTKSTGVISTFAGTQAINCYGQANITPGASATSVCVGEVEAIAVDSTGNVYFSVNLSGIVYKINSSGIISIFAGTGGYPPASGDGGPATAATIGNIVGLTFDTSGKLYIASYLGQIRVVSTSGIISTYASTPSPYTPDGGVVFDGSGNLYVAAGYQTANMIYKITPQLVVSLFAGTGTTGLTGNGGPATQAELEYAYYLGLDSNGDLLISQQVDGVVRVVSLATGIINPFAATPSAEGAEDFNGDNILATTAILDGAEGVATDVFGNVYISDFGNNRVREVASTRSLHISPSSISFPSTSVGSTSTAEVVTIENNGTGPVSFSGSSSITGSGATSFIKSATTCSSSLAVGATCTVSIEFKPKAVGTFTASLSILSNAPGSPANVGLTGVGH